MSDVDCVTDDCTRSFDTERAMKIHHTRTHGESLAETAKCSRCGETFTPAAGGKGKYCSQECYLEVVRDKVECTCEECGETFALAPSLADDRRYCSMDCLGEARTDTDRRVCPCGSGFDAEPSESKQCCSRPCRDEVQTSKPRPDDVRMLLWLLYEYEGNTMEETYRRANVVLDEADRLSRAEVRDYVVLTGLRTDADAIRRKAELEGSADPLPAGDDSWQQLYGREA